jgi:hypothetical protein
MPREVSHPSTPGNPLLLYLLDASSASTIISPSILLATSIRCALCFVGRHGAFMPLT